MTARARTHAWFFSLLTLPACNEEPSSGASTSITGATSLSTSSSAGSTGSTGTTEATSGESRTSISSTASTTSTSAAASTTSVSATESTASTGAASLGGSTEGTSTEADATSSSSGGPECGDGVVEAGETCDDGSGVGCESYHDGGAGTCVPAGVCSPGYVLAQDKCVAELWSEHVHIMVSNTCEMSVSPPEFTVQPGQKLRLDYHNHSQDYPVDVWMHYNGGYTDLPPGATWMEKYEHCFGPAPSEGWATISTGCSQYKLPIHCL